MYVWCVSVVPTAAPAFTLSGPLPVVTGLGPNVGTGQFNPLQFSTAFAIGSATSPTPHFSVVTPLTPNAVVAQVFATNNPISYAIAGGNSGGFFKLTNDAQLRISNGDGSGNGQPGFGPVPPVGVYVLLVTATNIYGTGSASFTVTVAAGVSSYLALPWERPMPRRPSMPHLLTSHHHTPSPFPVITPANFTAALPITNSELIGALQVAPTNLALQSQTFNNASWTKTNSSITVSNTLAPDGTNTAQTLVEDTAVSVQHVVVQDIIKQAVAQTFTFSIYAKPNGRTRMGIQISDGGARPPTNSVFAVFDISGGQIGNPAQITGNFTAASATIIPASNGYYRCKITGTTSVGATLEAYAWPDIGSGIGGPNSFYTGNGASGLFIWGAQLEYGSNATGYLVTTANISSTISITAGNPSGFFATPPTAANLVIRSGSGPAQFNPAEFNADFAIGVATALPPPAFYPLTLRASNSTGTGPTAAIGVTVPQGPIPVITNNSASFFDVPPPPAGTVINTMSATNNPTSWSITGGDPNGNFQVTNINSAAGTCDIIITAAGVNNTTNQNTTQTLQLRATNGNGTSLPGSDTISYTASSADGISGASVGTVQYPTLLNSYGGFGARRKDQPNFQPTWNVAGVDYHVGVPSNITLKPVVNGSGVLDPTFPGTLNSGNAVITVNSAGGIIDSWDFSVHGGYTLSIRGTCTIQNCKWVTGTNNAPGQAAIIVNPGPLVSCTMQYCFVDGNAVDQSGTGGGLVGMNGATGNVLIQYCHIRNAWSELFQIGLNGNCNSIIAQYNIFENAGLGTRIPAEQVHGDWVQIWGGGHTPPSVLTTAKNSYNLFWQNLPQSLASTQGWNWMTAGANAAFFTNLDMSNNVGIVNSGSNTNFMFMADSTWCGTPSGNGSGTVYNNYVSFAGAFLNTWAYLGGGLSPNGGRTTLIGVRGNINMDTGAAAPNPASNGWFNAPPAVVTNLNSFSQATTAKPAYLVPTTDSVYGQRIIRITGDPGTAITNVAGQTWQGHECHHYSLDNAWNADGTLLYIEERCVDNLCNTQGIPQLYLNGTTYAPLYQRGSELGGDRRVWHPTNAALQIYVNGNVINSFNPSTGGTITALATIAGYSNFKFGPFKGMLTNDGNSLAIVATRTSDSHSVTFRFNYSTQSKGPDIDLTAAGVDLSLGGETQISPLGTYIVVTDPHDNLLVYNAATGANIQNWPAGASDTGRPSHADVAVDSNGDEVFVGTDKNNGVNNGIVIKRRFSDGAITNLTSGGYSAHHSCRNLSRPGWVYVTYQEITPSFPPFNVDGEIIAVKLDGSGSVERYVQHRSDISGGYFNQPQAAVSRDGNKIIWKSNWGNASGPMQAYVSEISR